MCFNKGMVSPAGQVGNYRESVGNRNYKSIIKKIEDSISPLSFFSFCCRVFWLIFLVKGVATNSCFQNFIFFFNETDHKSERSQMG